MRCAHRNTRMKAKMKAYVAAARFQPIQIRRQVQAEMDSGILDTTERQSDLKGVLATLETAMREMSRNNKVPANEVLLEQLQQMIES